MKLTHNTVLNGILLTLGAALSKEFHSLLPVILTAIGQWAVSFVAQHYNTDGTPQETRFVPPPTQPKLPF